MEEPVSTTSARTVLGPRARGGRYVGAARARRRRGGASGRAHYRRTGSGGGPEVSGLKYLYFYVAGIYRDPNRTLSARLERMPLDLFGPSEILRKGSLVHFYDPFGSNGIPRRSPFWIDLDPNRSGWILSILTGVDRGSPQLIMSASLPEYYTI